MTDLLPRIAVVGFLLCLLQGCASTGEMDLYVPHACHASAEPFESYRLSFVEVPGFIQEVIATSARGALAAQGLDEAADPDDADVDVVNSFRLMDRNPPPAEEGPMGGPPLTGSVNRFEDSMGEAVQTGSVNRFVTHLTVDMYDRRTEKVIWTGSMYRSHAIQGGETFHDERAVLIIRKAYDDMFVGLTTPCE